MIAKLSWGKRVAILYIGFVALMVILVAGSMRQQFDLVAPDYYAQEIKYQETIDAGRNQSALSEPAEFTIGQANVTIQLPREFIGKTVSADLHFYSPVSAALDKKLKFALQNGEISIAKKDLAKTNYKVKLSWVWEGKKYYQESTLNFK